MTVRIVNSCIIAFLFVGFAWGIIEHDRRMSAEQKLVALETAIDDAATGPIEICGPARLQKITKNTNVVMKSLVNRDQLVLREDGEEMRYERWQPEGVQVIAELDQCGNPHGQLYDQRR